jgi:hypothetical protein
MPLALRGITLYGRCGTVGGKGFRTLGRLILRGRTVRGLPHSVVGFVVSMRPLGGRLVMRRPGGSVRGPFIVRPALVER